MKKTMHYKGLKAIIEVSLNYKTEKRPTGESFHRARIHGTNVDYYKHYDINSKDNLEDELVKVEKDFMDKIDGQNPSDEEIILQKLGYSK